MTTAHVGMMGHPPKVTIAPSNPEITRYRNMWAHPEYRIVSPGETLAMTFLKQARPEPDAEVIDFGCGTGRGGLLLALFGRMKVKLLDFADNCLDEHVAAACRSQADRISFQCVDLTKPIKQRAAYGFCCDMMEHIPPADVTKVLRNILLAAHHVFFSIATVEDNCGPAFGEGPLHLTIQPIAWWVKQLTDLGAVIHWSREADDGFAVYCSAWHDASEVIKGGRINVGEDVADKQASQNIAAGWQHVRPYDRTNREICLLAGGPSLAQFADKIKELRAEKKAGIVTVNGSYQWALDNGIEPSTHIVLDAREFNARFTRNVTPYTKYMIASQVHTKTLEGLPPERTYLWHSGLSDAVAKEAFDKVGYYFPVLGGSTVVLRAIPLLRMLGYWRMHVFGFDSCVLEGQHHSYTQDENDGELVTPVTCGGKVFYCAPWMVSQASEFRDIVGLLGDEIELEVYGDGLIAHMIHTGANLSKEQDT